MADENPDNIVNLPKRDQGDMALAAMEMQKKRAILQRASEIMFQTLERDALNMEKAAIVGDADIQKRHNLMDTARCLRVTMTWMMGPQSNPADPVPPNDEPSRIIS